MHTESVIFVQDLGVTLLIAGLMTILCHRLKQPIVFGYILAGIIIGPYTPPFTLISNQENIRIMAELGVIFLLFSLGLEFNLRKLSKVGFTAFIAAFAEIIMMLWMGYEIGRLFGWSKVDAIFLGAILSISSTTIIIKALDELKMKQESFSQLIFGILVIEDIFAIIILALLSSIALTGSLQAQEVMLTVTKLVSFLVASLILGILFIPKFLSYVSKFKSNEMLLITVLALCFGFCLIVIKLNYSVALAAFIIGAVIAESRQNIVIEHLIIPLRDMFSAIFFVSVGMLFDPKALITYAVPIIVITIVVVLGKVLACSLAVMITGRDAKTSVRVGMGLAQIGEFSFIIASLGITLNVTSSFLYPIAVAVSAITTLFTPYLIKYSDNITKYFSQFIPKPFAIIFELYASWLRNIKPGPEQEELTNSIKRSVIQILINLCIVIAFFLSSQFIATTFLGRFLANITNIYIQRMLIWGGALIISIPFLIAIYRKVKALSMILSELSVKANVDEKFTLSVRRVISEIIPAITIILIMLIIFILSARILPPLELLLFILVAVILLIAFLFPWFIKLHAKLQNRLIEVFKKEKEKPKTK